MNFEGHYWMTAMVAQAAGFDRSSMETVAYAAQQTDNNLVGYRVKAPKGNHQDAFEVQITQTMNVFMNDHDRWRIYGKLHFPPGEPKAASAKRVDGRTCEMNTTPDSPYAQMMLGRALASGDLYELGLACHMYCDTFAHQNYTGTITDFNASVKPKGTWQRILKWFVPDSGHAEVGLKPDQPNLIWEDKRLVTSKISNKDRCLDAFENLFYAMRAVHLGASPQGACEDPAWRLANLQEQLTPAQRKSVDKDWQKLRAKLSAAIGKEVMDGAQTKAEAKADQKVRIAAYRQDLPADFPDYNPTLWRDDAIRISALDKRLPTLLAALLRDFRGLRKVTNLFFPAIWKDAKNYTQSHYYRFQNAAKVFFDKAEALVAPVLDREAARKTYIKTGDGLAEALGIVNPVGAQGGTPLAVRVQSQRLGSGGGGAYRKLRVSG